MEAKGILPSSLKHQLLRDIEANPPTWRFKEIYDLRPKDYGESRSSALYRAVENRFQYLKKLKEKDPDRYWYLYSIANAHPVTDPEDLSSDEDDEDEAFEEAEPEEVASDKPCETNQEAMPFTPDPVASSTPSAVLSSLSPTKTDIQGLTSPVTRNQRGGRVFSSVAEATKLVYAHDVIHVDPTNPTKDRGFQVVRFRKPVQMSDGKNWLVTQLEIAFENVDVRDFDDVYNRFCPQVVCEGSALWAYLPTSGRHMLDDRPTTLANKAAKEDDPRAIAYTAIGNTILREENGLLYRPVLFVFGDMICSSDLKSPEFPSKDQPVKFYLDEVENQVIVESMRTECHCNVGFIRLHVVSEKPEPLESSDKDEHSIDDAIKGCD